MGALSPLRKLSLTKDLAEIVMAIVHVTVTVAVTTVVTVTMEVVVVADLVVESALSVANLVILLGNVLVRVAEVTDMVAGKIGMAAAAAVVVEDVMVLIGMVTVQGDVAGILVVGEGTDIVVTVLAHMTDADEMAPQNYGMLHSLFFFSFQIAHS